MSVQTDVITPGVIRDGYSYKQYRDLINRLLAAQKTTGTNHSDAMIDYTRMNVHRMNRLDKRTVLSSELLMALSTIRKNMDWLVLTEAWCGDAAQIIPVIEQAAEASDNINTSYILRDENLEIMDQFLQNGKSRSIPKLICLDTETLEILGDWGPRPAGAQQLYDSLRNDPDLVMMDVAERLHKWYALDKTKSTQAELAGWIHTL